MKYLLFLIILLTFICNACNAFGANKTTPFRLVKNQFVSVIDFELKGTVKLTGPTEKVEIKIALPQTINERQTITNLKFYPQPTNILYDGGTKYAEYEFIHPEKDFTVKVNGRATLLKYDFGKASKKINPIISYEKDMSIYTKPEKYIESNDKKIKDIAASINGKNEVDTVSQIYNYVIDTLNYDTYNPGDVGAVLALQRKKGDCSEYADLMTALCRAKNIPARVVIGYTSSDPITLKHAWVEVFFKKFGWVPFDPTLGDNNSATFNSLKPQYLYITNKRTDPILHKYYYMSSYYWGKHPIIFKDSFKVHIIK